MPVIPPNTISDIKDRRVRAALQALFFERSLLQYAFSYAKLSEFMSADDMQKCIVAWKEDEAKAVKETLNDRITTIYTENGISKTLRDQDPFGRRKDYIMMEGVSTSFSQSRAMEIAVSGVFRWTCPECEKTVWTTSGAVHTDCPTVHESINRKGKLVQNPCIGRITASTKVKAFSFDAEALTAVFALATKKTSYVSLQARDVKDENGR